MVMLENPGCEEGALEGRSYAFAWQSPSRASQGAEAAAQVPNACEDSGLCGV